MHNIPKIVIIVTHKTYDVKKFMSLVIDDHTWEEIKKTTNWKTITKKE